MQEKFKAIVIDNQNEKFSRNIKEISKDELKDGNVLVKIDYSSLNYKDALWMSVDIGNGASCHVGYKSCFYRSIQLGKINNSEKIKLEFEEKEKKFDPEKVYKGQPNPTKL